MRALGKPPFMLAVSQDVRDFERKRRRLGHQLGLTLVGIGQNTGLDVIVHLALPPLDRVLIKTREMEKVVVFWKASHVYHQWRILWYHSSVNAVA